VKEHSDIYLVDFVFPWFPAERSWPEIWQALSCGLQAYCHTSCLHTATDMVRDTVSLPRPTKWDCHQQSTTVPTGYDSKCGYSVFICNNGFWI